MSAGTDPRIRYQRAIARAEDLPRSVRHIAVLIAAHLNAQLVGGVAMAALMLESGYSKPTVLRATKRLRADGWLYVVIPHRRGRATVYRADVPALFARDEVSEPTPEAADEVSSATPQEPSPAVDRAFQVSPATPDRPLVVSPAIPDRADEVSPATPLVYVEKDVRTGSPVDDGDAARAVDEVSVTRVLAGLSPRLRPRTPSHVAGYRTVISQRLAAGWTVEQLAAAEPAFGPQHLTNPVGWWGTNVPVAPPAPAAAAPRRPDWCGECDGPSRMLELDDGRVVRCPVCNPLMVAATS